jgi:hypothetical protein
MTDEVKIPEVLPATVAQPGALTKEKLPSFIKAGDVTGTEDIKANEIRLPRLAIAQGLSDQVNPDHSSYIEGLKLADMFNDLTGERFGRGPFTFIPIRREVRRMEFAPRKDGGGLIDPDVPPNDPRNEWTQDEDGKRIPPRATKFVDFVVMLIREGAPAEPIVLSIKTTNKFNRAAAARLTTFIKLRRAPIYSGYYSVSSKQEKNDNGTFGVYVVNNIRMFNESEEPIYRMCESFAASLEGKTIVVEREPGSDDFDPDDLETPPGGASTDM